MPGQGAGHRRDHFSSQTPIPDSSNRAGIPTSPSAHRLSFQQLAAFGTKLNCSPHRPRALPHPPPLRGRAVPGPPARRGSITLRRRRPLATGGARCRLSLGPQRHRERPPGRRGPGRGRLLPARPGKPRPWAPGRTQPPAFPGSFAPFVPCRVSVEIPFANVLPIYTDISIFWCPITGSMEWWECYKVVKNILLFFSANKCKTKKSKIILT